MYVELRTPEFLRAETPVLRPIVSRNVPDAIHNYTIRTNPRPWEARVAGEEMLTRRVSCAAGITAEEGLGHRGGAKRS
jgi:hypothetical protein